MGNCFSPSTDQLATISGVKVFTVAELKKATKGFGKDMVIEESFGGVLRGCIDPKTLSPAKEGLGLAVAVKICYLPGEQALQEWLVHFEFLRLNSHPCLVKLIGYGSDCHTLFIVSEYFSNGSLERHIYRESRPKSLPWEIRLKVSIGAAQCLTFLHSVSRNSSGRYRGNLTASKILLDSDFNARVSYFGLETLASLDNRSHVPSHEAKSARFHYAPPEYFSSGKFHKAGDVYSFGVILLEILTGLENRRIILAKKAIRNDKENIAEMIDPDLENSYPLEEGMRMCEIIKQCLEEDTKKRPSMQQVLDNLNAIAQI